MKNQKETQHRKKRWANWFRPNTKGKQFLLLIRQPPCLSLSQYLFAKMNICYLKAFMTHAKYYTSNKPIDQMTYTLYKYQLTDNLWTNRMPHIMYIDRVTYNFYINRITYTLWIDRITYNLHINRMAYNLCIVLNVTKLLFNTTANSIWCESTKDRKI